MLYHHHIICAIFLLIGACRILGLSLSSEVVGAAGRVGSFLLNSIPNATATPRGVVPGCLTNSGRPIVVATPSQQWRSVYEVTVDERRSDLVWVGNGLLSSDFQSEATIVVPHFGVLKVDGEPIKHPDSPSTFVYGKHAAFMEGILSAQNISVKTTSSWTEIKTLAARKLLWASCMWLLCHEHSSPLSVSQVHLRCQRKLDQLVGELLPAFETVTGTEQSLEEILEYFESYSMSMPEVTPSLPLALTEAGGRNGVWLAQNIPQPFHKELLAKHFASQSMLKKGAPKTVPKRVVELPDVQLLCYGTSFSIKRQPHKSKMIIIVGGGIMGSSVALSLASRASEYKITVVDPNPIGKTTPASWAWLNANQKKPKHYKWLNELGMWGWMTHELLADLPKWSGSLVCLADMPKREGGYRCEGPLSRKEWQNIEPNADFGEGKVYFFPQEGSVDPVQAVTRIRERGEELGVTFVSNQNVTGVERTKDGEVCGIATRNIENGKRQTLLADMVVVAAGVACQRLAGIPLLSSPGHLVFASPTSEKVGLQRILVDTVRQSHLLTRKDGTLVIGGGALVVGGSPDEVSRNNQQADNRDQRLMISASEVSPKVVEQSQFQKSEEAVRPMPQDGLPVAGFVEKGLYAIVSHSGITLAPVLASLAASELTEDIDLDILHPYRPGRFLDLPLYNT